jgi:hypothetical protein
MANQTVITFGIYLRSLGPRVWPANGTLDPSPACPLFASLPAECFLGVKGTFTGLVPDGPEADPQRNLRLTPVT